MLSQWIFMTNCGYCPLFLHEIIEVQHFSIDHLEIKWQCWVLRPILSASFTTLLFNCFSRFLELSGPGMVQGSSGVPEAFWTPTDPIEDLEGFLNQNVMHILLSVDLGSTHWHWFSDGKRKYFRAAIRGFLCPWLHQYSYFLVIFSSWSICIVGNILRTPTNSF